MKTYPTAYIDSCQARINNGNPLNEVRMLADSILTNDGVLAAEKSIKYAPETSITGIAIDAAIRRDTDNLQRLSDAFFDTLREKYGE